MPRGSLYRLPLLPSRLARILRTLPVLVRLVALLRYTWRALARSCRAPDAGC